MNGEVEPRGEGGDAACWLGAVCQICGRIPDPPASLDEDGRCVTCRATPDL